MLLPKGMLDNGVKRPAHWRLIPAGPAGYRLYMGRFGELWAQSWREGALCKPDKREHDGLSNPYIRSCAGTKQLRPQYFFTEENIVFDLMEGETNV